MSSCEVCGETDNLHEHHIDGDETNNDPGNRIVLCASHHRRVHGDSQLDSLKDELVIELKQELPESDETHVSCDSCGYEWDTQSLRTKATCPSCQRKTLVEGDTDE